MLKGLITFTEQFFWTMVWIFLILIIGFFILGYAQNWGGPIGNFASWVSSHAEPQV